MRWAETACRLEPEAGFYRNTLGVAQFRLEMYQEALASLIQSEKDNWRIGRPHPADLAFQAMSLWRLGHKEDAGKLLARLREEMKDRVWARDPESKAFLAETEALIAGPKSKR
jgi:hypothetical protein